MIEMNDQDNTGEAPVPDIPQTLEGFSKLAPYFLHPLVLVGSALFLFFLFPVPRTRHPFLIAITVIVLGFGLAYYQVRNKGSKQYLTDIVPAYSKTLNSFIIYKPGSLGSIEFENQSFDYGIGTHPPPSKFVFGSVRYAVPATAKYFSSNIGVMPSSDNSCVRNEGGITLQVGKVRFAVFTGDIETDLNEVNLQQDVVLRGGTLREIRVPVLDKRWLELRVYPEGEYICDHAVWPDARFEF